MTLEAQTIIVLVVLASACFACFIIGYVLDQAWGAYAFFAGLVITVVVTVAALTFVIVGTINYLLGIT